MSTVIRCDICQTRDAPNVPRLAVNEENLPKEIEDKWQRKRFADFMCDVVSVEGRHAKLKDICPECWKIWILAYAKRLERPPL